LRGVQARDGVGPSDGRGGVGGHGAVDHRMEEAQLVLDLGRRRVTQIEPRLSNSLVYTPSRQIESYYSGFIREEIEKMARWQEGNRG
jgi:hypothetical protein